MSYTIIGYISQSKSSLQRSALSCFAISILHGLTATKLMRPKP